MITVGVLAASGPEALLVLKRRGRYILIEIRYPYHVILIGTSYSISVVFVAIGSRKLSFDTEEHVVLGRCSSTSTSHGLFSHPHSENSKKATICPLVLPHSEVCL